MRCPRCQHDFKLTRKNYLRSFWGRHTCPACGGRFKLQLSISYLVVLLTAWVVAAGFPALLAEHFFGNGWVDLIVYFAGAGIFVLPLDCWLDNRWRPAKEI